jgi:hypothetical protein
MSNRWPGGLIRRTPVTPTGPFQDSVAPGMWSLADAAYWKKQNLWPTQGILPIWIGLLGNTGTGEDYGGTIRVAASGAVYANIQGTRSGSSEAYTVKFTPTGDISWQVYFNGAGSDYPSGLALDSSENVYTTAGLDIGSSNIDTYLFTLDSSGAGQLGRRLSGVSSEQAGGVAVDSSGNIIVGSEGAFSPNFYKQAIVVKYNSSGTVQWQRSMEFGDAGTNAVAVDGSGNVYITGIYFRINTPTGFIAKLNSSGVFQWSRATPSGYGRFSDIAVTSSGVVYTIGYTHPTGISNPTQLELNKFDTNGNNIWSRAITRGGSSFYVSGSGIALDSSENVYVCGTANSNILIAQYDSSGNIQFQRSITYSGGASNGGGMAVDGTYMYITGYAAVSGRGNDAVVAKLPKDGSATGTYGTWTYATSSFTTAGGAGVSSSSLSSTSNTLTSSSFTTTPTTGALSLTLTRL